MLLMSIEFPEVTILIVTYDRPREIRRTIDALCIHIKYPGHLRWHIADDHSPGTFIPDLLNDYRHLDMHHSITDRKGWGANVNKALASIQSDCIFLNEDDYVAERDLDLTRGVALLEACKELGAIRYDGLEGHTLNLQLREVKSERVGRLDYLIIDKDSPHLNVYSHRPHLKHRRLHDQLGKYVERQSLGTTEEEFAHRVKDHAGPPEIAILPSGIPRAFNHVGVSRQKTEHDIK